MKQLTPEVWERVEALFHEALEVTAGRRADFLDRVCTDPEVRREVDRMLAASDTAVPALDDGIGVTAPPALAPLPMSELEPGAMLGAYRVIRLIGRGGMGEVYLAERADGQFEQRVAAKVLRAEAAEHLGRFHAERQILARLEHPGIARLLDGGLADGRPYMLMEFVPGEPLGDWCRERRLSLLQRLELFLQICEAVSFAHAHLVVHRDLKSGNVLVTADGRAKLLDFGVAKLIDPALFPEGTATRAAPLTLDHAAPEQLLGKAITTATDVYALGVVLYELLADRSPWSELRRLPVSVALSRILKDDPALPSATAVDAGTAFARSLRGDLDAIVMRAMRKEPALRYPTVAALQADIRAYLAGEPVAARSAGAGYVLSKFVRRHRVAVAAAVAFLSFLGAFTWRLAIERNRALDAEAQARTEAEAARQVSDYVVSMFDSAAPEQSGGKPLAPRELVDRGRQHLSDQLVGQPELRARMLATVGRLYVELGLLPEAQETLQQALSLQGALPGADPLQTAQYLYDLGRAHLDNWALDQAESEFRRSLDLRSARLAASDLRIAQALQGLGITQQYAGRIDGAIDSLTRARALYEATPGAAHGAEYGRLLCALGLAMHSARRWDAALELLAHGVDVIRKAQGEDHPQYLQAVTDYGRVLVRQGRAREAEPLARDALAKAAVLYAPDSAALRDLQSLLADDLSAQGRVREATDIERQMAASLKAGSGADSAAVAIVLTNLATDLEEIGAYSEALGNVSDALRGRPPGSAETTDSYSALLTQARLLIHLGRTAEARALLATELPADLHGNIADGYRGARLLNLGDCARLDGRFADAEALYNQAETILRATQPPGDMVLSQVARKRGLLRLAQRDFTTAVTLLRGARTRIVDLRGALAPRSLEVGVELAEALAGDHRAAEATQLLAELAPAIDRELAAESEARARLARVRRQLAGLPASAAIE